MRYEMFGETLLQEEIGCYCTYGIRCADENGNVIVQISDVSTDPQKVSALAERCTKGALAPEQLWDVVENFLEE
ncbi:MAG: hypothetical protein IJP14_05790 [Clostridia bacterium]|nr:hypothetical protein [Clostridia bacterium]